MSFLVFQLRAPLASFGNSSGEYRGSDGRPRRSAVVGLLAAALGITRDEDARFLALSNALTLGYVVVSAPTVLIDFHTIAAPLKRIGATRRAQLEMGAGETVVTKREYLQSGHWLVVLGGELEQLERIAAALHAPTFPLYLGRKSCVLSAFTAPVLSGAPTAEAAFGHWLDDNGCASRRGELVEFFWEQGLATAVEPVVEHRRNDRRTALSRNSFSSRVEREGHLTL